MIPETVHDVIALRTMEFASEYRDPQLPLDHDPEQLWVDACTQRFGRSRMKPLTGTTRPDMVEVGLVVTIVPPSLAELQQLILVEGCRQFLLTRNRVCDLVRWFDLNIVITTSNKHIRLRI